MQVHLSGKLHPYSDIISKTYKSAFLATHLMAVLQPSGYSIFHDGVTPVSVSTLKPLLGVIEVLPLKSQASPILSVCI